MKELYFSNLEHGVLEDVNLKRDLCNKTLHWPCKPCKNQEYVELFFYIFWSNANFYSHRKKFQVFALAKQGQIRFSGCSLDEGLISTVGIGFFSRFQKEWVCVEDWGLLNWRELIFFLVLTWENNYKYLHGLRSNSETFIEK